jgi:hypothetical protein
MNPAISTKCHCALHIIEKLFQGEQMKGAAERKLVVHL